MAGFRMHVGTSSALGCGYAGVLYSMYGVPAPTATVAGALCGFAGMLPDLDSDYGVPLREAMSFAAATVPVFLVNRFESLQLSRNAIIIIAIGLYLFVRFGIGTMIRKFTVHRGMFHSIPAMLIFGGITYLLTGTSPTNERFMMAGGVMGGFFSHLLLDEIYSFEFKSGRWRTKKSFGTAMKLWGDDGWTNFSAYAKVAVVGMGIVGDHSFLSNFTANRPELAKQINDALDVISTVAKTQPQYAEQVDRLRGVLGTTNANGGANARGWTNGPSIAGSQPNNSYPTPSPNSGNWSQPSSKSNWNQNQYPTYAGAPPQAVTPVQSQPANNPPSDWQWPVANQSYTPDGQPQAYQSDYNTAQRPMSEYAQ
jgi:hypothetical protein